MTTESGQYSEIKGADPHEFQFLLMPRYSTLSLVSALETLQNANRCARERIFSWSFYSPEELQPSYLGPALFRCSPLEECTAPRDVVVIGGPDIAALSNRKVNTWLARHARGQTRVTGLMTGAFTLAEAGLLQNTETTLHWQFRDAFCETYPDIVLSDRPFLADGLRCTSSGGVSAIDLFLEFIAQIRGRDLAYDVAEAMNYSTIQQVQQIASAETSVSRRIKNPHLSQALDIMERNLETPISPGEIASSIGISTRQIERLFRSLLGKSPKQYYMHLRLRRAYFLLTQTQMGVTDIGFACGFHSPGHFARCFRVEFGLTPTQLQKDRNRRGGLDEGIVPEG